MNTQALLVPRGGTRVLCERSFELAMAAGALAPAVMAGLLLAMHEGVVAHALDEAIDLGRRFGGMGACVDRLEQIQREERGA